MKSIFYLFSCILFCQRIRFKSQIRKFDDFRPKHDKMQSEVERISPWLVQGGLFVCLNPINVNTSELIGPKSIREPHITQGRIHQRIIHEIFYFYDIRIT